MTCSTIIHIRLVKVLCGFLNILTPCCFPSTSNLQYLKIIDAHDLASQILTLLILYEAISHVHTLRVMKRFSSPLNGILDSGEKRFPFPSKSCVSHLQGVYRRSVLCD